MQITSFRNRGAAVALAAFAFGLFTSSSANAQFIVDAAGPRNVFFDAEDGKTNDFFHGFKANLKTSSDPSFDVDYFTSLNGKIPNQFKALRRLILGFDYKVAADNGTSQIFKQVPAMDFSAIANYSWEHGDRGWLGSATARFTEQYDNDYAIYDTTRAAGSQYYKRDWAGQAVTLTVSYAPGNNPLKILGIPVSPFGIAFGLGYANTNNYSALPSTILGTLLAGSGSQTVVGSGTTVRYGSFQEYGSFPLTILPTYNLGINSASWLHWLPETFPSVFSKLIPPTNDYEVIIGPYASYTPLTTGRPADAVGLNIVLEMATRPPVDKYGVKHWELQKNTFPLSIFVERDNAFLGKPNVTVGAALTYKFP